ncbi:hypothetical protein M3I53_05790 [Paraburkholderia sp. CNPSo 3272]|uniref:hypothetical protein n=1 Tax=Paraburkholderia sp. CNPSo 3272 TaxID=2940931 RepID=UPI0020B85EBE|nr:hypothetical protein [Paraburkholderia sp. CNPSo 3272]MCP3722647.1 hypothetical protein [Paraburkholderia sp. CNPSo 3272]
MGGDAQTFGKDFGNRAGKRAPMQAIGHKLPFTIAATQSFEWLFGIEQRTFSKKIESRVRRCKPPH